jgi:hypothetical protein
MTDGAMTMSGVYAQPHHRPAPVGFLTIPTSRSRTRRLLCTGSLTFCAEPTASYNLVATQTVIVMSDKQATADDKCQACHGTGTVAGARPVRTGPFLLNPPLCRVCGGTGREPRSKHPEG